MGDGGEPTGTENATRRAAELLDLGRAPEAAALLWDALQGAPNDARILTLLSLATERLGAWADSLQYARLAVAAAPEWAEAYCRLSQAVFPDEAMATPLPIAPYPVQLVLLATRYSQTRGPKREALKAAEMAVALAPEEPRYAQIRAMTYLKTGRVKAAKAEGERLLRLAPDDFGTYITLVLIALRRRAWRDVEAHTQTALRLNPSSAVTFNNLGVAHERRRRYWDAAALYLEAARLDPREPLYRDNLTQCATTHLRPPTAYFVAAYLSLYVIIYIAFSMARGNVLEDNLPPALIGAGVICAGAYAALARWKTDFLLHLSRRRLRNAPNDALYAHLHRIWRDNWYLLTGQMACYIFVWALIPVLLAIPFLGAYAPSLRHGP